MICRKDIRINRYDNLKNIIQIRKLNKYTYVTLIPIFKRNNSTEYNLNELQIERIRLIRPNSQGCKRCILYIYYKELNK